MKKYIFIMFSQIYALILPLSYFVYDMMCIPLCVDNRHDMQNKTYRTYSLYVGVISIGKTLTIALSFISKENEDKFM